MSAPASPILPVAEDGCDRGVDDRVLTLPDAPAPLARRLADGGAIAWRQDVVMHTYAPGEPDRYPMFLNRRVYQGSSGRVYPLPFIDRIEREGAPRPWRAVHLENRWLRLMVMPDLGGRIHVGYDKTNGYDFLYRNNVIKPALVGLAGPWISGGIEFNWPQHHRPATFQPVDFEIAETPDGAVTVWCSDHDPFARMKGMHGVRLRPDRAAVEVVVRLHNRTSETQTFLWWANAAVRVNDDYQAFFPTDVQYVADHARRAVTAFPAADRRYYGVDYPARPGGGERLDWYRNIPVPTSYMVTDTDDDFLGGYDHGRRAGFVHVADHHVAPGKKLWTWGNAPFGAAWERLLTDADGPYMELMAGVYTDNQPDFAWLEPGETKTFMQTWYPIQQIGPAHQANARAAVRLDVDGERIQVGLCVTEAHSDARVRIEVGGEGVAGEQVDLSPGQPYLLQVPWLGAHPQSVSVSVHEHDGAELIRWQPRPALSGGEPPPATAPPGPDAVESVEELYLTGVHLTQYRHPTRTPEPYFAEALRRDPGHAATHVALASASYRRGCFDTAVMHAEAAIARLTLRNRNPRDGEPHYLLGLAQARRGEPEAARDAFAKAAWDVRWAGAADVELARLAARSGHPAEALRCAEVALRAVPDDSRAEAARVVSLRLLGRSDDAEEVVARWRTRDPLDQLARALAGDELTGDGRTRLDVARDLDASGDADRALELVAAAAAAPVTTLGNVGPIAWYQHAAWLDRAGRSGEATISRAQARSVDASWCFPSGLDDDEALRAALRAEPGDGRAASLLGMLLFDVRREREALQLWTTAIDVGHQDAVTLRNAAIATVNLDEDGERARELYDRAVAVDPSPRLLYERDQLLARFGATSAERLSLLEHQVSQVLERDDLTVAYCRLLTAEGRAASALDILSGHAFAPWEGGEGQAIAAWEGATRAVSEAAELDRDLDAAIAHARFAIDLPPSLGEVRHPLTDTTPLHRRLAELLDKAGRHREAKVVLAEAVASGSAPVTSSLDSDDVDYFATSLPDLLLFARKPALAPPGTLGDATDCG